ncbi:unnamed protein product [Orchesella dallaii]|uniref:Hemicentin-1 n=1 Tax=Orchesella dallaii TaxID=48710 RepID=A0ABP1PHR8_9HEXA
MNWSLQYKRRPVFLTTVHIKLQDSTIELNFLNQSFLNVDGIKILIFIMKLNSGVKCAHSALAVLVLLTLQVVAQSEDTFDGLMPYRTTNGSICVTPCSQRGWDFNWCYTREKPSGWTDDYGGWGHCSPGPGVTYKGQPCQNSCEKYGGYYWCYVDQAHHIWDYCGPTTETPSVPVVVQHKTIDGEQCVSACDYLGESYGWCYKAGGSWNKCSPKPYRDINGERCSNTCDYRGETYTWCYLVKGGWGKCGQQTVSSDTQYTFIGSKCLTPCVMDANGDGKNRCYDATKEKRECSRVAGLATNNLKCFSECDYRGGNGPPTAYNWCWTSADTSSQWSTCSNVETDPAEFNVHRRSPSRKKVYFPKSRIPLNLTRSGNRDNIVLHRDDQGNRRVLFVERLDREGNNAPYPIRNSEHLQQCAMECLRNWQDRSYFLLEDANTGTLASGGTTSSGIRLDQQSRYTQNGVEYLNLQMQVNGLRRNKRGQSTTIGEVQIERDVARQNPQRVIDALLRSIYELYGVHVRRFEYPWDYDENQPGPSKKNPHDHDELGF